MPVAYHVYSNDGLGGPIDYSSPVATVAGLTWMSGPLAPSSDTKFGVRAFDVGSGLEELNLDCAAEVVIDATGLDVTDRPQPPTGLRVDPLPGGSLRVGWHYPIARGPKAPTGFHVYVGTGGTPDYSSPAATVAYSLGFMNAFAVTLTGLTGGTAYTVAVRAYNASGDEPNATVVTATAKTSGPAPVDSLTATPV